MRDAGGQRTDFRDPVLVPALLGQERVDGLARADIGDHGVRPDLCAVVGPDAHNSVAVEQQPVDADAGAGFAAVFGNGRDDVLGKGGAATHRVPGSAL